MKSFTMRNKVKRGTKITVYQREVQAQPAEVIVLDSSRSGDESLPEIDLTQADAEDKGCSNATAAASVGFSKRQVKHLQVKRKLCAKGNTVAPIFLSTIKHNKSKRSSDEGQTIERTQSGDVLDVISPPVECNLPLNHGSILSTQRGQLSQSSLHSSLEETQTSNPAFRVRTVFKTLQTKASERLLECSSTGEPLSVYEHSPLHGIY